MNKLISCCNFTYFTRFPKSVNLKISYALYLADFLKKPNLAYELILEIEYVTLSINLAHLYKLNRIKSIIDEEDVDESLNNIIQADLNPQGDQNSIKAAQNLSKSKRLNTSKSKLKIPKIMRERLLMDLTKLLERATNELLYL